MLSIGALSKTRGADGQGYCLEIPRLELRAGQRIALIGASGSGKSTVLDLLALALSPDPGGTLHWQDGEHALDLAELWRLGRHEQLARLRSRAFGYVLQTGGLLRFLDVRGNIRLPRDLLGLPDDGAIEQLASQLGIDDLLQRQPGRLSVGQRQRVSIARALAHRPAIVLADEPTAALDPLNAERVMQLLVEQATARNLCLVISTHDEALAERYGLTPLRLTVQRRADGGVTARLAEHA
ncbi:ABC transporter ATP-binding protein [Phytopseudomonas dryadis]|uniref:ABC transporter ATP-binding protein n=1 Tax=Phytopseudomonas dryadis TaxID=2487520 RepID=A0A4Q9R7P3_9GAMM|nr:MULTISPECIES: ABC transporter ATP-binding protein [Pseudomonas]TBU96103.1 ABC transporter ATP-binding protein [Pseudomonas dryadis]TBV01108.1 ABC transporter ATP-binding protein [Pseudomonas dryadis]TBV13818.1 ABC transporter ATP-binding protein [Pseudomonas sp. FRB 230]